MTRKKKREEAETAAAVAGFGDPVPGAVAPSARVTPVDIQQKMFGKPSAMHRGYDEREVDQFLDDVTEELARQITENKSLREQLQRAEMRPTTPLGSEAADADALLQQARAESARILSEARDDAGHVVAEARGEAIAILEAARGEAGIPAGSGTPPAAAPVAPVVPDKEFIHREREFLQSLAGLIQGHAEAIREDLKRVRGTADPETTDEEDGAALSAEAARESGDAEVTDAEPEIAAAPAPVAVVVAASEPTTAAAPDEIATEPEAEMGSAPPDDRPEPPVAEATEPSASAQAEGGADPADAPETPGASPVDEGPATEDAHASTDGFADPVHDADDAPANRSAGSEVATPIEGDGTDASRLLDLTSEEDEEETGASASSAPPDDDAADGPRAEREEPEGGQQTARATSGEAESSGPDDPLGTPAAVGARSEPASASALAEAATGGRDAPASGSFGRWMEEAARPSMHVDDDDEHDRRSLRELFWGED